jgi:predicted nucleic acid-binding protein
MTGVFTDTDILLDYISGRQPFTIQAARIFEANHRGKILVYTTSLSFSNLYYVLRKVYPHMKVISQLDALSGHIKILKVDEGIIKQALKSSFKDFEDAIQYYSAMSVKNIGIIVTRNIKDYKDSVLPVMTPETFLSTLYFSEDSFSSK